MTLLLKNRPTGGDPGLPPSHNFVLGPDAPVRTCTADGCHTALGPVIAQSGVVAPSTESLFTIEGLASGTYSYWCTIDTHSEFGMIGTLTVTE